MVDEILFFQGAEGKLYTTSFLGQPCVVKERFKKMYRHPTLDEAITTSRLRAEARAMARSRRGGVDCPIVYFVDLQTYRLYMEWIDGITLREFCNLFDPRQHQPSNSENETISTLKRKDQSEAKREKCPMVSLFGYRKEIIMELLPKLVGSTIAKLHNVGLIHGDITTSNIMLRRISSSTHDTESENVLTDQHHHRHSLDPHNRTQLPFSIALIDFGLSSTSSMAEDRAVDLYVMERALNSSHSYLKNFMTNLFHSGYLTTISKPDAVAQKLDEVRQRGRKRLMIG